MRSWRQVLVTAFSFYLAQFFVPIKTSGVCTTELSVVRLEGAQDEALCSKTQRPVVFIALKCQDGGRHGCSGTPHMVEIDTCGKQERLTKPIPLSMSPEWNDENALSVELSLLGRYRGALKEMDTFQLHTNFHPNNQKVTHIEAIGKIHKTKIEVALHRTCVFPLLDENPSVVLDRLRRDEGDVVTSNAGAASPGSRTKPVTLPSAQFVSVIGKDENYFSGDGELPSELESWNPTELTTRKNEHIKITTSITTPISSIGGQSSEFNELLENVQRNVADDKNQRESVYPSLYMDANITAAAAVAGDNTDSEFYKQFSDSLKKKAEENPFFNPVPLVTEQPKPSSTPSSTKSVLTTVDEATDKNITITSRRIPKTSTGDPKLSTNVPRVVLNAGSQIESVDFSKTLHNHLSERDLEEATVAPNLSTSVKNVKDTPDVKSFNNEELSVDGTSSRQEAKEKFDLSNFVEIPVKTSQPIPMEVIKTTNKANRVTKTKNATFNPFVAVPTGKPEKVLKSTTTSGIPRPRPTTGRRQSLRVFSRTKSTEITSNLPSQERNPNTASQKTPDLGSPKIIDSFDGLKSEMIKTTSVSAYTQKPITKRPTKSPVKGRDIGTTESNHNESKVMMTSFAPNTTVNANTGTKSNQEKLSTSHVDGGSQQSTSHVTVGTGNKISATTMGNLISTSSIKTTTHSIKTTNTSRSEIKPTEEKTDNPTAVNTRPSSVSPRQTRTTTVPLVGNTTVAQTVETTSRAVKTTSSATLSSKTTQTKTTPSVASSTSTSTQASTTASTSASTTASTSASTTASTSASTASTLASVSATSPSTKTSTTETSTTPTATTTIDLSSHSSSDIMTRTPSNESVENYTNITDTIPEGTTAASLLSASKKVSPSGAVSPVAGETESDDTFWPIVAALVIGIPSIIVFGIAITVIHKRRLGHPARFLPSSMYPSL